MKLLNPVLCKKQCINVLICTGENTKHVYTLEIVFTEHSIGKMCSNNIRVKIVQPFIKKNQ